MEELNSKMSEMNDGKKSDKKINFENNTQYILSSEPPAILTEDLKDYGINEKKNIDKEKTRIRNQPYAFLGGGFFGEQLTLDIYPETIGCASKGGMAFDNKTLGKDNELISAKEVKFISLVGTKKCKICEYKCPPFQKRCSYCNC